MGTGSELDGNNVLKDTQWQISEISLRHAEMFLLAKTLLYKLFIHTTHIYPLYLLLDWLSCFFFDGKESNTFNEYTEKIKKTVQSHAFGLLFFSS